MLIALSQSSSFLLFLVCSLIYSTNFMTCIHFREYVVNVILIAALHSSIYSKMKRNVRSRKKQQLQQLKRQGMRRRRRTGMMK